MTVVGVDDFESVKHALFLSSDLSECGPLVLFIVIMRDWSLEVVNSRVEDLPLKLMTSIH